MKSNRIILMLGYISVIPVFFATLLNTIIGMAYWSCIPSHQVAFYIGKCNNEFVAIVDMGGVFGMAFIITSMMIANRHSDKMEDLDAAIQVYRDMTNEMEKARDKYTEQLMQK